MPSHTSLTPLGARRADRSSSVGPGHLVGFEPPAGRLLRSGPRWAVCRGIPTTFCTTAVVHASAWLERTGGDPKDILAILCVCHPHHGFMARSATAYLGAFSGHNKMSGRTYLQPLTP